MGDSSDFDDLEIEFSSSDVGLATSNARPTAATSRPHVVMPSAAMIPPRAGGTGRPTPTLGLTAEVLSRPERPKSSNPWAAAKSQTGRQPGKAATAPRASPLPDPTAPFHLQSSSQAKVAGSGRPSSDLDISASSASLSIEFSEDMTRAGVQGRAPVTRPDVVSGMSGNKVEVMRLDGRPQVTRAPVGSQGLVAEPSGDSFSIEYSDLGSEDVISPRNSRRRVSGPQPMVAPTSPARPSAPRPGTQPAPITRAGAPQRRASSRSSVSQGSREGTERLSASQSASQVSDESYGRPRVLTLDQLEAASSLSSQAVSASSQRSRSNQTGSSITSGSSSSGRPVIKYAAELQAMSSVSDNPSAATSRSDDRDEPGVVDDDDDDDLLAGLPMFKERGSSSSSSSSSSSRSRSGPSSAGEHTQGRRVHSSDSGDASRSPVTSFHSSAGSSRSASDASSQGSGSRSEASSRRSDGHATSSQAKSAVAPLPLAGVQPQWAATASKATPAQDQHLRHHHVAQEEVHAAVPFPAARLSPPFTSTSDVPRPLVIGLGVPPQEVDLTPLGPSRRGARHVALQVGSMYEAGTQVSFDPVRRVLVDDPAHPAHQLKLTAPQPAVAAPSHPAWLTLEQSLPFGAWQSSRLGLYDQETCSTMKMPPAQHVGAATKHVASGLLPGGWGLLSMAVQNLKAAALLEQVEKASLQLEGLAAMAISPEQLQAPRSPHAPAAAVADIPAPAASPFAKHSHTTAQQNAPSHKTDTASISSGEGMWASACDDEDHRAASAEPGGTGGPSYSDSFEGTLLTSARSASPSPPRLLRPRLSVIARRVSVSCADGLVTSPSSMGDGGQGALGNSGSLITVRASRRKSSCAGDRLIPEFNYMDVLPEVGEPQAQPPSEPPPAEHNTRQPAPAHPPSQNKSTIEPPEPTGATAAARDAGTGTMQHLEPPSARDTLLRYHALLGSGALPGRLVDPASLARLREELLAAAQAATATCGLGYVDAVDELSDTATYKRQLYRLQDQLLALKYEKTATLDATWTGRMSGREVMLDKSSRMLVDIGRPSVSGGHKYTTLEETLLFIRAYRPATLAV